MTRDNYLKLSYVTEFCQWFSTRLESRNLAHSWVDRRSGQCLHFDHIYDAFTKYDWRFSLLIPGHSLHSGRSFGENHAALKILQAGLRSAVTGEHDMDTLCWSRAVMRWGGVFPRNGEWLRENSKGLAAYLASRSKQLNGSGADESKLDGFERFNSGMSKIYSLLADDFIIYDTRVAAALGWIIVKFCQELSVNLVPEALRCP